MSIAKNEKRLTIRVPATLVDQLTQEADRREIPPSALARHLIATGLAQAQKSSRSEQSPPKSSVTANFNSAEPSA